MEDERFTLCIRTLKSTYTISRFGDHGAEDESSDDEHILEFTCELVYGPKRHKQHFGETVDFSLISAKQFGNTSGRSYKFFGGFNLKSSLRTGYVYLPPAKFDGVETNIRCKAYNYIEIKTAGLRYGHGDLLFLHLSEDMEPV